jgi:AraC-like DNA-binding protein
MSRPDDSATLPGIYLREFVDLCGRFDVTPAELLRGSPVLYETLADPATKIGLGVFHDLVERGLLLTDEPGLAYFFGLHMRLSWHGFLGFAAMTAPTVRHALRLAERYASTRTGAIMLTLHEDEGHGVVVLEPRVPLGDLYPHLVIALFSGLRQLAEALTGQPLVADVELSFDEPAAAARFRHVVPGTLRFGQPMDRVLLGKGVLDSRVVTADPVAMQLARDQCERELAALAPGLGLVEQVQRQARVIDGVVPTVEDVAKRLHVSTRTLKRRLAEHSTTFSDVVDRVRHRDALVLLLDARLPIDEIASRLGYSDTANFTRAFKRWTGTTPAAHRTRERAGT